MKSVAAMLLDSGRVKRYHTVETIGTQNVADHSWGVTLLCEYLLPGDALLLKAAMLHDVAEFTTGDIPGPFKRILANSMEDGMLARMERIAEQNLPVVMPDKLNSVQVWVLRMADYLEGLIWCQRQEALGNTCIQEASHNYSKYAEEYIAQGRTEGVVPDVVLERAESVWRSSFDPYQAKKVSHPV